MIISNENKWWEKCYLCGNSNLKDIHETHHLSKCKSCGFVFYKKIPSEDELNTIYSAYEREEHITQGSIDKIHKELGSLFKQRDIKKVLDIACGECYTLDVLKSIDPNLDLYATEHASAKENVLNKGYTFIEGEFYPIIDAKIDLIVLTEAIEHINDINEFLRHANSLLNRDGLIYITTPNYNSLERIIMRSSWGMIKPPEHLSYFTPATIDKAMTQNGFEKVYVITENISIFRIIEFINRKFTNKSSKNVNSASKLSPQRISDKMQNATNASSLLKKLKKIINFILNTLNCGSSLKAVYKKKV